MENDFLTELKKLLPGLQARGEEPMSRHTSFKTGGPALVFAEPANIDELKQTIFLAKEKETPYYVLGNGTNMLVSDDGYRGIIISLKSLKEDIAVEENEDGGFITASAGTGLTAVAMKAAAVGLTGMEFAAGIPGSVGGAVVMNAGAYGGEIKDILEYAELIGTDGECIRMTSEELKLGYRYSIVPESGMTVVRARFRLLKGDPQTISRTIAELNAKRRDKQPLEYPSAGSTFKRPEGYFAGKLIEDAGLRGFRIGGAGVSEKHCGFIINYGDATSTDIINLIEHVQKRVFETSGVRLETEVRLLGF